MIQGVGAGPADAAGLIVGHASAGAGADWRFSHAWRLPMGCQRSLSGGVAMGPPGGFVLNRSFWPAGKIALAGKIAFLTLGLNTRDLTFKISVLPAGRVLPAG